MKTNIPFLINLVTHPHVPRRRGARRGSSTRRRSCSSSPRARTGRRKLLTYLGEVIVNGHPLEARGTPRRRDARCRRRCPPLDAEQHAAAQGHARQAASELGPGEVRRSGCASRSGCCSPTRRSATPTSRCWPRGCAPTTCCAIADALRHAARRTCSRWRCGAGRRSTRRCGSSRSRPGSGWRELRETSPEHPLPDAAAGRERRRLHELSRQRRRARSCKEAAEAGIDLFRIFDALNWLPNMQARRSKRCAKTDAICEAAICYTGDILDPKRDKYTLKYYVESGEGTGEARRAHPGHQGHGRPVQAVRGRSSWCKALQAGDRHPDPLPHARHGRRAGRRRICWRPRRASTSSTARWRRCRA